MSVDLTETRPQKWVAVSAHIPYTTLGSTAKKVFRKQCHTTRVQNIYPHPRLGARSLQTSCISRLMTALKRESRRKGKRRSKEKKEREKERKKEILSPSYDHVLPFLSTNSSFFDFSHPRSPGLPPCIGRLTIGPGSTCCSVSLWPA